jgi:hypothetical protein
MTDPKWITVVAMILIGSFAIDRIVTALLFLLSFAGFPDPSTASKDARPDVEKKYKLWYFFIAGVFAMVVLGYFGKIRVLAGLGYPPDPNPILDAFLTGIVLVGGADRIASLKPAGSSIPEEPPEPKPLQVIGQITLIDSSGKPKG